MEVLSANSYGGPQKSPTVGERVMFSSIRFKSPQHYEGWQKVCPNGVIGGGSLGFAAEFRNLKVNRQVFFKVSSTTILTMTSFDDDGSAYEKGANDLGMKIVQDLGVGDGTDYMMEGQAPGQMGTVLLVQTYD